ncbi:hypothetical protein [Chryseobacterium sp. 2R14A]|uniref:hypothetical protein n=1 Tax=Chryseobacterium sp. 2R14A TaxID=3380353 RepID=UPI003CF1423F
MIATVHAQSGNIGIDTVKPCSALTIYLSFTRSFQTIIGFASTLPENEYFIIQLGDTFIKNMLIAQDNRTIAFTSAPMNDTSHFTKRAAIGSKKSLSTFQMVGTKARFGGPCTQTAILLNPILGVHSNTDVVGYDGRFFFNVNSIKFGYYLQHNSSSGPVWDEEAFGGRAHRLFLTMGSKYAMITGGNFV